MKRVKRKSDSREVGEEQGSGLDRIAEAERLLLIVQAQVVNALHQLRNLDVVSRPFDDLRVVAFLELEAGGQDHEYSSQHHVGRLVEEVVVQLGSVE